MGRMDANLLDLAVARAKESAILADGEDTTWPEFLHSYYVVAQEIRLLREAIEAK